VMQLQEETPFRGTAFGSTAKLDLCKLESLTQSMQEKTASPAGSYTLVVTPKIKLNGEISGRALESTFDPPLTFRYDRTQFYLVRNEEFDNPLALAETGILSEKYQEANTMILLGREIAIPTLRSMSLFGLIGSLIGLILLGLRFQQLSLQQQEKFFQIKYSSMMIDIQSANISASSIIDVTSMNALAKLAERFSTMILHAEQDQLQMYYVQAGGTTYRFTMSPSTRGAAIHEAIRQEVNV